jgi:hypothetical protein
MTSVCFSHSTGTNISNTGGIYISLRNNLHKPCCLSLSGCVPFQIVRVCTADHVTFSLAQHVQTSTLFVLHAQPSPAHTLISFALFQPSVFHCCCYTIDTLPRTDRTRLAPCRTPIIMAEDLWIAYIESADIKSSKDHCSMYDKLSPPWCCL